MKNHVLCIDLDDTLSDTYETIMKYAIKHDIENLGRKGIINNKISSSDYFYFARSLGWSRDDLISFFDTYYPTFLKEIKPKKESSYIMNQIKDMNIKIYIVTSRKEINNEVFNITKNWLLDNNIPYDELYIDSKDKDKIIKKLKANYFIDDSLDNCIKVKESSKNTNVFWIQTEYNKDLKCDKEIIKINNLNELLDNIRRINEK